MTHFVVHTVPGSPYARAVLATLIEKQAPFRVAGLAPGVSRSEAHLSRHPFGRVPVLEQDGFMLYETQAILRYLDRVIPAPALTPGEPRAAARMDQIMGICDWYLFQGVANVIAFQRIVGPRLMRLTPDETAIAGSMPKARVVFAELSRLLGEKPYVASSELTLADLMIAPHLDFLAQTPEWTVLTEPHPNLVIWLERVTGRRSLQATTWERVVEMAGAA